MLVKFTAGCVARRICGAHVPLVRSAPRFNVRLASSEFTCALVLKERGM